VGCVCPIYQSRRAQDIALRFLSVLFLVQLGYCWLCLHRMPCCYHYLNCMQINWHCGSSSSNNWLTRCYTAPVPGKDLRKWVCPVYGRISPWRTPSCFVV